MNKKQLAIIEDNKKQLSALYGENKELKENPDLSHSIKCFNGTFVPKIKDNVRIFKGIPFALPPIGERRWKRPAPVEASDKIFEAYYNGKSPIQTHILSERASCYPQSEDCLYLNMWINDDCQDKNKPIMVFIHGGSYGWGGTADPLYDGYNFIKLHPDVILITIAYRIGLFGFVDLSYLEGGDEYEDAPNLGLLDQIEALRWIKQNGQAFNGDINNVTVFGESAGGGSVSLLPIIPEAKGLFHRVIAESGSVALTYSKIECKLFTDLLKKHAKTKSIRGLMDLSEEELIKVNEAINDYNNFPMRDGRIVPLNPYEAYEQGASSDIDMMIGTNANELNYWFGELGGVFTYSLAMPFKYETDLKLISNKDLLNVKRFMKEYHGNRIEKVTEFYNEMMFRLPAIKQAEGHSLNKGNVYMYYWKEPSHVPYFKCCHAVELAYVFNNIEDTIYTGKPANKELAKEVSTMWVNFAKRGNPSTEKITWNKYDVNDRKTLFIKKDDIKEVNNPLAKQKEHLDPLIKYMINPGLVNINFEISLFKKISLFVKAVINASKVVLKEKFTKGEK
ncbi:MAG: carboxylesterase family protein [Bacilli bacterium]|nr:carboxylesterase family protein [Bacilli bacterium]